MKKFIQLGDWHIRASAIISICCDRQRKSITVRCKDDAFTASFKTQEETSKACAVFMEELEKIEIGA
jgi:hypothetical protein